MKYTLTLAAAVVFASVWAAPAQAQYGRPGPQTPAVSPMIGLAGRGSPAIRYFSTVQPIMENRALISKQAAALSILEQRGRAGVAGSSRPDDYALPQTGHVATFNNTGHYFPRR